MLAQFSIWPLDDPHLSQEMADVAQVLDQVDADYHIGPMSTTIQGEWQEVMQAIQACHEAIRSSHQRVLTTITIDDDATGSRHLQEATAKMGERKQPIR